ncbi:PD-(D/E)XK nuclease family protein [bacterium]|nr:PD-(D/E)XK nuclease family protein [bacterium]
MIRQATTHFLLVPDSGSARRLRRVLAFEKARTGVVVGVWSELVVMAMDSHALQAPDTDWNGAFHGAMSSLSGAFWQESYQNSPDETVSAVSHAYVQLLEETDPRSPFGPFSSVTLPGRAGAHLSDLARLHEELEGALPENLALIQLLLGMEPAEGLRRLHIYSVDSHPRLSNWQRALIARINSDTAELKDESLASMLSGLFSAPPIANPGSSLHALQENLFDLPDQKFELDDTLQWLGVRDFQEEAEVAAGMVQTLLKDDAALSLSDIGILVPERVEYEGALADAFQLAGLPMSGLADGSWCRDLGRELILNFLYVRQKPSPVMALAACLSSPLMPWSLNEGARAAQNVIDGDWAVSSWHGICEGGASVLELFRRGDTKGGTLAYALRKLVSLLKPDGALAAGVERARVASEQICAMLEKDEPVEWPVFRKVVAPERLPNEADTEFSQEGLTVWREGREVWRPVRHLLVLGFCAGHYPSRGHISPVFSEPDIGKIIDATGVPVETQRNRLDLARSLFKRQLGMVSDSISFMVPRRDPAGDPQSPSEAMEFMSYLLDKDEDSDEVLSLDLSADREQARHLSECHDDDLQVPGVRPYGDISIGKDLLGLRTDGAGNQKPESPSALEKMMVSPLAWLLQRVHAEPALWGAEEASVLLLGTLSHDVFEHVFAQDAEMPSRSELPAIIKGVLAEVIGRSAPFMQSSAWKVECRLLEAQLVKAAEAWHDMLSELDAKVIGTEKWLKGDLGKLPIHGQADALLSLPGNRLLIVDYKKSSASSRRGRMEKGYDSQVELYRKMIQTGGVKDDEEAALAKTLKDADSIGVVYFNMNDSIALSDTGMKESAKVPGWEVMENDVSAEAMTLIQERISELNKGKVRLNRDTDAEFFDKKANVKPYALEVTPLTGLFMLTEGEGEE